MFMFLSNNALSTKAKSMYGHRLVKHDYEELLRKHSVNEVAAYLKNETIYKEVLKDVHENSIHRGQLEAMLKREKFVKQQRLLRYADVRHDRFYQYSIFQEEIDQILSCIRALMSDDYSAFVSNLPLFMNPYMSFDLKKLLEVKSIKDLKAVLADTIYAIDLLPCLKDEDNVDYARCETALKKSFYEYQRTLIHKKFKGELRKNLLAVFDTQMELQNICKIYRMKEYFHSDKETIRNNLIVVHQRLSAKMYEELLDSKDGDALLAKLETSPYKIYTDDKDFVYIEYYCNKITYSLGKKYMHFSNSAPLIYLSYSILDEMEIENLINIIEGIRYGVPIEKIESLLIY
ncbi:MAG: hypothetical protein EOM50_13405 [Erysipelotrichia bacterium]|nr:hypothetical protein [Erysipelotrichia bacterium]